MPKVLENGNLKFIITIMTIVFAAGGGWWSIGHNTLHIKEHYEDGCKPSIAVRQDVAAMQATIVSINASLARMDRKLDDALAKD